MKRKEIKKLDKLWALKVKEKAGYVCEKCKKKTKYLNAHHFFSKSNMSVRFDVFNGICLCVGCHVFSNDSAHKSGAEFYEFMIEKNGQFWYDALREKKNKIMKPDYEEVLNYLEEL